VGAAEVIVDSSSLIAILKLESDAWQHAEAIEQARWVSIAAPTLLEASIVARRLGLRGLRATVGEAGITVVDFTVQHTQVAVDAHRRYGRGSGSKARLNFGDCISYALAKSSDEPLLFKGDDFRHTDVKPALA
jgi:ribonuclease VapC